MDQAWPLNRAREGLTSGDLIKTLAHLPAYPAIYEAVAAIVGKPAVSRAELHVLLDACLDLAEIDSRERPDPLGLPDDYRRAKQAARAVGRILTQCALGWTEDKPVDWDNLKSSDPVRWRGLAFSILGRAPHAMPAAMVRELTNALFLLNMGSGTPPRVLEPWRAPGHGRNPLMASQYEFSLWLWIYREKGWGRKIDEAVRDVADAAGCTTDAVRKWRTRILSAPHHADFRAPKHLFDEALRSGMSERQVASDRQNPGLKESRRGKLMELVASWKGARAPAKAAKQEKRAARISRR